MDFPELGISAPWVQALEKEGISRPLPIQERAIPPLLGGTDAYLSAPTGTGKTLAYLLPILGKIDPETPRVQAMVLAPTHELAAQIHRQAQRLAQLSGRPVRSQLLIGGANIRRQVEGLRKKKPHLVVGSAGRILELVRMKKLKLPGVGTVVVDEADRMLAEKPLRLLRELARAVPAGAQRVFVSATENADALAAARGFAPELVRISAGANQVNPDIRHLCFEVADRSKADLLRRLVHALEPRRALVFVHRNKDAELVAAKMEHYGIPVADLHGARGKLERQRALERFRSGKVRLLIVSDLAARGLDIGGVTHVFNHDVPSVARDYLHRAGRTGRAGAAGCAVSLASQRELRLVKRHASELGIEIRRATLREGCVHECALENSDE